MDSHQVVFLTFGALTLTRLAACRGCLSLPPPPPVFSSVCRTGLSWASSFETLLCCAIGRPEPCWVSGLDPKVEPVRGLDSWTQMMWRRRRGEDAPVCDKGGAS
jgi:hypothetical protein